MYTDQNFKTKKAFREAVERGEQVSLYAPGLGSPRRDGRETVEGPHYPAAHTWYAQVEMKDGLVVRVR